MRVYHDKIYGKNNKYNCPSNNNNKYIMAQFSSFSFRPKIRARSYSNKNPRVEPTLSWVDE